MKLLTLISVAALAATPVVASGPALAYTAFQTWAQGQGLYVPSKERLYGVQDDLADLGLAPPPPPPGYRLHQLQRRYGVVGMPEE